MKPKEIIKRIGEEVRTGDPDSPVNQVIARWKGHDFTVKFNGQWRLEGFVDYFRWWNDLACAVDLTQPRSLPPQCFDPIGIARLFGLPVEEFVRYLPNVNRHVIDGLGRVESAVRHLSDGVNAALPLLEMSVGPDPSSFSKSKRSLYEAASDSTPLDARKLCGRCKLKYSSYTRRLLADLAAEGRLKRVRCGYLRVRTRQNP